MTLRVLTLSSLFPDAVRPNFGVFVERQTLELARRDDVDLTVIAPIGIGPWPLSRLARYAWADTIPETEQWKGMTVHRPRFTVVPGVKGRLHVRGMVKAVLPLVRRLHAEKPFDVIDASFFFPDGPTATAIARKLGIPCSIKARGADIHFWGTQRATRKAVRRAGHEADGLLAVSKALRGVMVRLGMPEDKIKVHYTGVDLERFQPHDRMEARRQVGLGNVAGPVLLCVGNLLTRKGQHLLIQALRRMPDAGLALAGGGETLESLQKLAKALNVEDRVAFLGVVPHEELPLLYNVADVMVLPSESEGLANAWIESLACGTPIVITDVGGAREVVTDPRIGRIVARDPGAIVEGIKAVLAEQTDRNAIRNAALAFTWQANCTALHAHLKGLVEARATTQAALPDPQITDAPSAQSASSDRTARALAGASREAENLSLSRTA